MEHDRQCDDLAASILPPDVEERLRLLQALLLEENSHQNLIAKSTEAVVWNRHIEDSLQLIPHLRAGSTVDIGSGGGFPGLVLACANRSRIFLVELRHQRADFLRRAVSKLGIDAHAIVVRDKVQNVHQPVVANITARAVASLTDIFAMASHLSDTKTRWVLPKGRSARSELEAASETWQGNFEIIPSITDPSAAIIVAERVRRRHA